MKHELVHPFAQGGKNAEDLPGVHVEGAVDAPQGGAEPERRPTSVPCLKQGIQHLIEDLQGIRAEEPRPSPAHPPFEVRRQRFHQHPANPWVYVKVVMGVDEAAGQTRFLVRFPLALDLLPRQLPHPGREPDGESGLGRRPTPWPFGSRQGPAVCQMHVPAYLQARMLAGQRHRCPAARLSDHQAGTGQSTASMSVEDRLVDPIAQPKIIRDEYDFLGHGPLSSRFFRRRFVDPPGMARSLTLLRRPIY